MFKYLKAERQPEQIGEAITNGEAVLHDALMHRMVRIALQTDDLREARMACESLLAMRFNYRSRGEAAVSVNVAGELPELIVVQETLDPSLVARITNAGDTPSDQPPDRGRVPIAPRRSLVQQEPEPFAHEKYNLADRW